MSPLPTSPKFKAKEDRDGSFNIDVDFSDFDISLS